MPTEQEHLIQARHNEALAKFLTQDMAYKDWVITTAFYAALHYVEANFAKRFGYHGEVHGGDSPHVWRLNTVKKKYSLTCWNAYRRLYEASKRVRYLEGSTPQGGIYKDQAVLEFLTVDLATIRKELNY